MPQFNDNFFEIYKYLLITALFLIAGISVIVIMAMAKAKKDTEENLNLIIQHNKLLEECLEVLKKIETKISGKSDNKNECACSAKHNNNL